ncbi:PKD domain-containing protein [uncultured Polaribacter sp.]|uniref:PKD domain-containing protein n=1 Tax=uncultured Polaribacter sp. TaxID=174711 RepID=UPI002607FCFF|nr:PKD domain-containing protein [uncultured Polaribacter sp.]
MKKIIKTFKQISILLLIVSFISCEEDAILPEVKAGFTYTLNIDTGTVTFINTSEMASTYEWNFGDEMSSTEINPIHTYETGEYTVTLKARHVSGASDTFESVITVLIPEIASLPITFDGENTKYEPEIFGGTAFAVVDNPSATGANPTASKVGKITNTGNAFEGIAFELGAPIDLTTDKSIKMLVWSDKALPVLLKLEQGNAFVEMASNHLGSGWETMYFTFDSTASFRKLTLFIDGPGATAGDFFIDEISQIATDTIPCMETMLNLPIDFDCNGIAYGDKIVGDVSFTVVDNPELSGVNDTASKVGRITNFGVNWENAFFNLDTAIDFTTDKGIKMKLYSTQALPIKLKLQDGTAAAIENDQNHGGTGWEELTFSFTSSDSYNDMVVFVDGPGTAAGTFYIDDIQQVAVTVAPPACTETLLKLPIDFDCDGIDYVSKDTGDVAFEVIDNPEMTGINNTQTKVGKMVFDSNQPWENMNLNLDTPINFSTDKNIKLKLWSSSARAIKLKVETGGAAVENDQNHTGSGWEELTFTLNTSDSFSNFVLFVDGGSNTAGTFYIDDIEQVSSVVACTQTNLEIPIDFDCEGIDYVSKDTGDVAFEVIDNPEMTGINNTQTKVGKMVFDSNQPWENMNLNLDTPVDFSTNKSIKLKLWSSSARAIKLKFETGGAAVENDQNHTGSGWEELTFTLGTSDSFSNFIIFVDGGSNTAGTFYIDDIEQITSGGGGGGSTCPAPPAGEFISDGDFEANAGCWLFNDGSKGGTTSLSTTVSNGGGSNSGQITTTSLDNPGLKQERFGVGSITPNTAYIVKFDIIASDPLADGAVFQAFTFSEQAEGSGGGAAQHILVQGLGNVSSSWETKTYEFTTAANVDGGLSLLLELVCGGAATCKGTVNIDNVSITKK